MIYQFRPAGVGYGGSKKTNNEWRQAMKVIQVSIGVMASDSSLSVMYVTGCCNTCGHA